MADAPISPPRTNNVEKIKQWIPTAEVGKILGNRAAMLKQIEGQFNCVITVHTEIYSPFGITSVEIMAQNKDQCRGARDAVLLLIQSRRDKTTAAAASFTDSGINSSSFRNRAVMKKPSEGPPVPQLNESSTHYLETHLCQRNLDCIQRAAPEIQRRSRCNDIIVQQFDDKVFVFGTEDTVNTARIMMIDALNSLPSDGKLPEIWPELDISRAKPIQPLIQMNEESLREVNRSAGVTEKTLTDAEGNTTTWKVGGNCMAPFEENGDKSYYPARINSFGGTDNLEVEVTFYFYGNKAVVQMEDLWNEEAAIARAVAADEAQKSKATNTNTRASSSQQPSTSTAAPSLPELVPVPPDVSNMSWYMAGYHSGYLKGMQHAQNSWATCAELFVKLLIHLLS